MPETERLILLVRRGQPESSEALDLLRGAGVEALILDADDPGVAPSLPDGVGTAATPALLTSRGVVPGVELIRLYLSGLRGGTR